MKDKILFFVDGWFFHYGIARDLQNKYDCDIFAIIDVEDKAKQFFEHQSFVDFKKTWYHLDNISYPKKPDLNYLENIEEKYNIDLWKIAYSDRYFYRYNKFHKFDRNEILSLLEQECRFFDKVLEETKPNFLATFIPIHHHHFLLHQMCENSGITPLTLATVKLWKRMMISKKPFIFDLPLAQNNTESKIMQDEDLQEFLKNYDPSRQMNAKKKANFEDNKIQRYNSIFKFFITPNTVSFKKKYSNYGRTKHTVFKNKVLNHFQKNNRKSFLDKHSTKDIDTHLNFIYFPLHYEPERILLVDNPYHSDQISVISNIAKSIPVGYELFVKEHPFMETIGWRDTSFYKELLKLSNVKLIHPSVKNDEIIKKSSLVIAIAGSTIIEAAFYKKPSIVFAHQLFSILSSVTTLEKIEDLPGAIKKSLETKFDYNTSLKNFITIIENNSFEFDFLGLAAEFAYKFGFKGPVMDSYLKPEEIKNFLDKHKESFSM